LAHRRSAHLQPRVPKCLHDEMIKSVPKMARKVYLLDIADGASSLGARVRTAKRVLRSPVYYAGFSLPRLGADLVVDLLRIYFPRQWRCRLTPAAFYRNATLKAIKYALQGVCSLLVGALVPLAWPHPYAFLLSEVLGVQTAEFIVGSCFGQVE